MLRTPCAHVPRRAKLVRHNCSLARFGRQACTNAAHKATTPLGSNAASGGHAQTDVRRHSLHSFGWRRNGAAKATRVANAKPPKSAEAMAAVTATDPATATTTSAQALTGHISGRCFLAAATAAARHRHNRSQGYGHSRRHGDSPVEATGQCNRHGHRRVWHGNGHHPNHLCRGTWPIACGYADGYGRDYGYGRSRSHGHVFASLVHLHQAWSIYPAPLHLLPTRWTTCIMTTFPTGCRSI